MESNNEFTVNDSEVPLKTDHNQSDKGLEISREDNSESESIGSQKSNSDNLAESQSTKDDSDVNQDSKADKSGNKDSRLQYSREELIQMSKQSLARIRPKYLDNAFNNPQNGLWNPEKWISSRSPNGNTINSKQNYSKKDENFGNKRINSDLKDRVVEEESDIILSPQRGSFGTGCHVSSSSFGSNRSSNDSRSRDHYSERNKMDEQNDGSSHRSNVKYDNRKVGSGRIVPKDRERSNDWSDRSYDRVYEHRDNRDTRDNRDNRDYRTDDYNDRRSNRFERRLPIDFQMNSNRKNRFESNKYREHKYYREEEENEPEWFTEGPTSKHDTIELKGFDDDSTEVSPKDSKEKESKLVENKSKDVRKEVKESFSENQNNSEPKLKVVEKESKSEDFDINAMFKSDDWFVDKEYQTPENKISNSVGISDNVDNETDVNIKSRFKRWFNENQVSNPMTPQTNEFSQRNENIIRNQKEGRIAGSMSRPSNTQMSNLLSPEKKIFELLSRASNQSSVEQMSHQKLDPSKAMSLAQIEENLQQMSNGGEGVDDKKAFERLLIDLAKKSSHSTSQRSQNMNELRNETTILTTPDSSVIIPKSMSIAPSILEMLREEENKEAMADLHRNNNIASNQISNGRIMSGQNIANALTPQNNQIYGTQSEFTSGVNPRELANWQNTSPMTRTVRPNPIPTNQDVIDNTNFLIHKSLMSRQHLDPIAVKQQLINESIRANTPNRSVSKANFFTPTSVMRNMHSDKDKDLVKSVPHFNDMTSESNSSQQKFINENILSKPSPMRPILKSNNPIGQSVAAKQSPISANSDPQSMAFTNSETTLNSLLGIHSNLYIQQQMAHQNSSQMNSHQRNINTSNVRPFNLGQTTLTRTSTPSLNAMNMNSNQHILQMLNNTNVRPNMNPMQINQMMSLQHNSVSDGRQLQYSQSRPITATNVHQMLSNNSNSNSFNSFDRNLMSDSESVRMGISTTYSQPRPQIFQNPGLSQANRSTESRFMGLFGREAMHHTMPELPTVPLQNALTLDDIES